MITTVTACWDRPDHLAMHLESLLKQSVVPERIIIVDNMSDQDNTDRHINICKKYDNVSYHRLVWKRKRHRVSACLNFGVEQAETEFVAILDVDCLFDNDYIERCVNVMSRYRNMAMSTPAYRIPKWNIVKPLLEIGKTLDDIIIDKHIRMGLYNFWKDEQLEILSTFSNPKPIIFGSHFDGSCWFRTAFTKEHSIFDPKIIDGQNSRDHAAVICLMYGQSLVVLGDIPAYHMEHGYSHSGITEEAQKKLLKYLSRKWPNYGLDVPSFNPLIPVEPEGA